MVLREVSIKRGRSNGRHAPTMPRDDSTMGQYRVGVSRSGVWLGEGWSAWGGSDTYMLGLCLRC